MLQNMQRAQNKHIEDTDIQRHDLPSRLSSLMDELIECKEKLRQYKASEKLNDERSTRVHQKNVHLTMKNQQLSENGDKDSSSTQNQNLIHERTINSQSEEIVKLRGKIDSLEKVSHAKMFFTISDEYLFLA